MGIVQATFLLIRLVFSILTIDTENKWRGSYIILIYLSVFILECNKSAEVTIVWHTPKNAELD